VTNLITAPAAESTVLTVGDRLAAILDRHDDRERAAGRPTTRELAAASLAELDAMVDGTDYGRPDLPDAIAHAWEAGHGLGYTMTPARPPKAYSDAEARAFTDGFEAGFKQAEDEAAAEVAWLCEAFSVPAVYAPGEFGGWGGYED
jgi:hypothetical protein